MLEDAGHRSEEGMMSNEDRTYYANRAAEEAEAATAAAEREDLEAAAAHRALQRRYLEQASVVGREIEATN